MQNNQKIAMFSSNFVWGAASSSFQIEGATRADARGPSIWDHFCSIPGKIADRSNGDVACDHYHLWERDLDLMVELGIKAYRFSVAWPRIFPEGRGKVESRGLDFYSRLIDGMLMRGLTPFVTLYHWDLPQSLQNQGGWAVRSTAEAFAEYSETVAKTLGDRVSHWITHNEPFCAAVLGHRTGEHAPGYCDGGLAVKASHHLLLSHGMAMERLRAAVPKAKLGITLNLTPAVVVEQSFDMERDAKIYDGDVNRWYLDATIKGQYPEDMLRYYENQRYLGDEGWSFIQGDDLKKISFPLDFLGVNFYTRAVFGRLQTDGEERVARADPTRYTAMGWEICPGELEDLMMRLWRDYKVPEYYITENGAAFDDQVANDGKIHDSHRIRYYSEHLRRIQKVCDQGVPLKGYFAWSIMDNFEWAYGYAKRFGLVWVDYATQKRQPKDSFYWYRDVIENNGIKLGE